METNQFQDDPARLNSNYYELAWKARTQVFDALLEQTDNDLWETLKRFFAFESQHTLKFPIEEVVNPETGKPIRVAGGSFEFKPRPLPIPDPHVLLRDLAVLLAGDLVNGCFMIRRPRKPL